jgi:hypothetical protein
VWFNWGELWEENSLLNISIKVAIYENWCTSSFRMQLLNTTARGQALRRREVWRMESEHLQDTSRAIGSQHCNTTPAFPNLGLHIFCKAVLRPPLWSSGQIGDVLCFLWGTNWIYICYLKESRPHLCSRGQSSWLLNGDVLCFLWGTNWIYVCYVEESRPPLWYSGQSSWLQIGDVLCFLWGTNWIYMSCRRK